MSRTFTLKEFAAANGLSEETIYRRIKCGEIKIKRFRVKRFRRPVQYDAQQAARHLTNLGYCLP
jgi:predicted DNA-binding transcriptional regulator AlpA